MKKYLNPLLLLLAALLWGISFSFQSIGGKAAGPLTFNAARCFTGVLALLPAVKLMYGSLKPDRDTLKGGIMCGICVAIATNLQQVGIIYTSPGKAGFITAAYMIIVAVISLFTGKMEAKRVLIAVVLGTVGLYFICITEKENLTVNEGDLLCLLCSLFFAVQILIIDSYGDRIQPVKMCAVQFLTAGILTLIPAFIMETPDITSFSGCLLPLLYVGIVSTGAAYSLQMLGMRGTDPSVASLIMSLESVFSVLGEWVILGSTLSNRVLFGCALMFAAITVSQINPKGERKNA